MKREAGPEETPEKRFCSDDGAPEVVDVVVVQTNSGPRVDVISTTAVQQPSLESQEQLCVGPEVALLDHDYEFQKQVD